MNNQRAARNELFEPGGVSELPKSPKADGSIQFFQSHYAISWSIFEDVHGLRKP